MKIALNFCIIPNHQIVDSLIPLGIREPTYIRTGVYPGFILEVFTYPLRHMQSNDSSVTLKVTELVAIKAKCCSSSVVSILKSYHVYSVLRNSSNVFLLYNLRWNWNWRNVRVSLSKMTSKVVHKVIHFLYTSSLRLI